MRDVSAPRVRSAEILRKNVKKSGIERPGCAESHTPGVLLSAAEAPGRRKGQKSPAVSAFPGARDRGGKLGLFWHEICYDIYRIKVIFTSDIWIYIQCDFSVDLIQ